MKRFEEEKNDFSNSPESIEEFKRYFKRRGIQYSESSLIEIIRSSKVKNELFISILALRDIGTEKAIPALKDACFLQYHDAQSNAILTINQIAKENETQFYGDCLCVKKYSQKGYALWALLANSNDNAIDQVIDFLEKQLKRTEDNMGYVTSSVCYLNRYRDKNVKIEKVFEKVRNKFHKFNVNTKEYLISVNLSSSGVKEIE